MERVHTYKPLQAKMSSNKSAAKTITVNDKLEGKEADYVPIGLEYLHKHPSAALTAVVNLLNCHMADMFITMLAVVGDKYGHTIDDMIETVKADPRWESVQAHPLMKSLSYFDQRDADETVARSIGQKATSDMPVQQLQEETSTTTIKKMRLKKAATVAASAPAPAEEAAVATVPAEEAAVVAPAKPAKKATKKSAAAATAATEPAEVITTTVTHEELESYGGGAEEAPAKPVKKATKKAAAAVAEEAAETPAKPVKKATKKAAAAAVEADTTAEITEQMKTMAVAAAAVATPAPIKKTVPKKTATK